MVGLFVGLIVQMVTQAPPLVCDISHSLTQGMVTLQRSFQTFIIQLSKPLQLC